MVSGLGAGSASGLGVGVGLVRGWWGGVHGSRRGVAAGGGRGGGACSSGSAQSRDAAGPDARLPWTVAHSQPTCSKGSHCSKPPCSKASSCASTAGLPRLLVGLALRSLGSGTDASAASAAAAAGASTEPTAAIVAGKEEQDEVEDAAGSSSGGSETERLEPVCCGTVGSEQITEAAHPPFAADDAK